jgi:hypothetical protein
MGFLFEVCPIRNGSFIFINRILVIGCRDFIAIGVITCFNFRYPFIHLYHY